eukprot:1382345-Rhodomonas_salina.2
MLIDYRDCAIHDLIGKMISGRDYAAQESGEVEQPPSAHRKIWSTITSRSSFLSILAFFLLKEWFHRQLRELGTGLDDWMSSWISCVAATLALYLWCEKIFCLQVPEIDWEALKPQEQDQSRQSRTNTRLISARPAFRTSQERMKAMTAHMDKYLMLALKPPRKFKNTLASIREE